MPGDDARRARIESDVTCRPNRARPARLWECLVDGDAEPSQRQSRILASVHRRRAGMVLLAGESDIVLPDADDGSDDADLEPRALQPIALLDVGLQIADMTPRLGPQALTPGEAGCCQRLPQRTPARTITCGIDRGLADVADVRTAAEQWTEMPLLVAP